MMKGVAVWGIRCPHVRGYVVAEIIWQQCEGSPACMVWCRVLVALEHLAWEIPNVFMHCLHDKKKLKHFRVLGYGPHWLSGIVINHSLDLTNELGSSLLIRKSRVSFPSCRTFVITIRLTKLSKFSALSSDWHPNTLQYSYWGFRHECQAIQHVVFKFVEERIASWCCFSQRRCSINKTILLRSWQKEISTHIREIKNTKRRQITHRTLYIYVYIYVYTYRY